MKYKSIKKEEELKGKVGKDWFSSYDDTRILGNIDFCISPKNNGKKAELESLLWAEAKTKDYDTISMFAQLIITIGKERTFDKHLPPAFLGAFDFKKIVFVPYNEVSDIFYLNDFNWHVTPSNHETKEFLLIKKRIKSILEKNTFQFDFLLDEKELKFFIKNNIAESTDEAKIQIDKNNFVPIYLRWLAQVKPYINFDWNEGRKKDILDSDFFLADLFVDDKGTTSIDDDTTINDELFVVFKKSHYEISKKNLKSLFNAIIEIKDKNKYEQFWKKYRRSPLLEFQQYIIDRRDLLIPQDVRERKGAFFTPQIWVEKSQKYLAEVLGENWQENYYIWDCAAGTGNLLVGLANKYNIYASTVDQADVNVMHQRINNGANLLHDQVFQFDFLNDDFDKLPKSLQEIISDPKKRKKLVVFINPPYAEATSATTVTKTGKNKKGVATNHKISTYYNDIIGNASNEIFALFMARVYEKIPNVILGQFSTLKFIQGTNFRKFKDWFKSEYLTGFVVPANTFDNVKGSFPIGFTIWRLNSKNKINDIICDVYESNGGYNGKKIFYGELPDSINRWIKYIDSNINQGSVLGLMVSCAPDFQHNKQLAILSKKQERYCFEIKESNLLYYVVYFAVRHCLDATWLNDRDQFLMPNENWEKDTKFHSDCLAYTLFTNNIQSKYGINHWIPFTEKEVNARSRFQSSFMTDLILGKSKQKLPILLLKKIISFLNAPLDFSPQANKVFDSGRALWKYYHKQSDANVNATLYDIREYFQGRQSSGRMNTKSEDEMYMSLITDLRTSLKKLAEKIANKAVQYEFLK